MTNRTYLYPLSYKLNFIPGILLILFVLVLVVILPSTTKIWGYTTVIVFLIWFCFLVFLEKKKVANNIVVADEGITAERLLSEPVSIKWTDIQALRYSGRGLYLVSGKLEKYIYAEIIAANKNVIVIRRELEGFHELVNEIQIKTGKLFQAEDAAK